MKKLEALEQEILKLSPEELEAFRAWFLEHDAAEWDREIASHARSGKLDALAREAKSQYEAGESTEM